MSDLYGDDISEFKASSGWMSRFLKRSGLVSHRVTSTCQELQKDAARAAETFFTTVGAAIKDANVRPECVGNMDETPL